MTLTALELDFFRNYLHADQIRHKIFILLQPDSLVPCDIEFCTFIFFHIVNGINSFELDDHILLKEFDPFNFHIQTFLAGVHNHILQFPETGCIVCCRKYFDLSPDTVCLCNDSNLQFSYHISPSDRPSMKTPHRSLREVIS